MYEWDAVADGTAGGTHNTQNCDADECNDGYHPEFASGDSGPQTCVANVYTCTHGDAVADGTAGGTHNTENCDADECNDGYHYVSGSQTCAANVYTCMHGEAVADGTAGGIHNTQNCATDRCNDGYHITGTSGAQTCAANVYLSCMNGTKAADGTPGGTHNTQNCSRCDEKYHLTGNSGSQTCALNTYGCPRGIAVTTTISNAPDVHNTQNCASCTDPTDLFIGSSPKHCVVDDDDDDNDGVDDAGPDGTAGNDDDDGCPRGDVGWTSSAANDVDGDGCRDATEDTDDDGDGTADSADVDDDNDGLIEIHDLNMFHNINYNLAGTRYDDEEADTGSGADTGITTGISTSGSTHSTATTTCGTGVYLCGYELTRSLNFAENSSYSDTTVKSTWCPVATTCKGTSGNGFPGVGASGTRNGFAAIFDGNGHSITGLYMRGSSRIGLFRRVEREAVIRHIGVVNANVYGGSSAAYIGILVGYNLGAVIASYAKGGSANGGGERDYVGGLVGYNEQNVILASYATGAVSGGRRNDEVGGLVGLNNIANIIACYATGSVSGGRGLDSVGGLIGWDANSSNTIVASYATGNVDGGDDRDSVGKLIGQNNRGTFTASYGFGSASNVDTAGIDGTIIPIGCTTTGVDCTINDLTLTKAGVSWNRASDRTLNLWDFGDANTPPKLKYAQIEDFCTKTPTTLDTEAKCVASGLCSGIRRARTYNDMGTCRGAGGTWTRDARWVVVGDMCGGSTGIACGAVIPGQD